MITLDVNSNYCDRGGGIRTYHQAKIAWFNRQPGHRYYLVVPGPRAAVRRVGRRVVRIEVYGLPLGSGYRLMLDYPRVGRLIRRVRPELVEVGDPFFTGWFCLLLGRLGQIRCRVSAFYHSDPIETWVVRWANRGRLRGLKRPLAATAGRLFYRLQRAYDVTIVTSRAMQGHLAARGVTRLERIPLGVDRTFFAEPNEAATTAEMVPPSPDARSLTPSPRQPACRRMLFVGRLIADKAADLLWEALPQILRLQGVEVTVLGSGPYQRKFAAATWPGYRYLPYVSGRQQLAEIYRQHDILLAPGPYETFGLAVLEAMASGLVVVGPDRGGTAELLAETQSPFVFRAGDLDGFVRVVAAVAAANLAPHRQAALAAARRYGTWHEAIGRLMEFYEQQPAATRSLARSSIEQEASGQRDRSDEKETAARRAA
ncbi:MAG TPA: glycosyltransferase [Pirellulales bacterium]|nr:glycosyltransferase [Pirellulales bacterium]